MQRVKIIAIIILWHLILAGLVIAGAYIFPMGHLVP